jgi:hypothetical protein
LKIVEGIVSARSNQLEEKATTLLGEKALCENLGKPNFKVEIY